MMKFILTSLMAAGVILNTAVAAPTLTHEPSAVVNKNTCATRMGQLTPFILVLDKGDNLHEGISKCAKDAQLLGASISGLGQVENPTLAYFSSDPKEAPTLTTLKGFYELASMNGDITNNDNNYYTHIHAVLADEKFHGIAGHVDTTTVGLTVEVTIVPLSEPAKRTVNPHTGFGLIVH